MSCGERLTPEWLIGMDAGAVCRVLENPAGSAIESIVDDANEIAYQQGRHMSAWVLAGFDDAGTIWRSPDGRSIAVVGRDRSIGVRSA